MEETAREYLVVLVTAPSEEEATKIAGVLVECQLAACVSLAPIQSVYTWQGNIERDREWQLTIKTARSIFPELERKIRELHSYEVPEIIAIPIIAGSQEYLSWLGQSLNPQSKA
ncbi:divalent-cation tolerance protein CutA [Roseofilum casamattae]|uniref:Divalent-cation tolerance protein CutA n=1 Tax=Roseofilum casamattae BLCC-M143 TaxID=3022442 RepID=A0ABT7BRB4_9CYAN|nr:divalent-cation tolerance protein CutA [Roseofilum casamattae]MDJ1181738.1 divalent-cation tolerance protein CutA [Roseofilum casamattae BLCC-M143]